MCSSSNSQGTLPPPLGRNSDLAPIPSSRFDRPATKAPPPRSTAGKNYTKFACLPNPFTKASTLTYKDDMLHKSGEQKAESNYFVSADEYLDDKYPNNEGNTRTSMGSPKSAIFKTSNLAPAF